MMSVAVYLRFDGYTDGGIRMNEMNWIEGQLIALGEYVRERYADRDTVTVSSKKDANDLLTEVDLEVQRRLSEAIRHDFPDDVIVAEELDMDGFVEGSDARSWVLDPIDGTQNFVRGIYPAFGISVALAEHGLPIAAGVAMPMTHDLFLATKDGGAFRNGMRLQVSGVPALDVARVEIDFGDPESRPGTLAMFSDIITGAGQIRCHCAAVVGLCSVATGDGDAYFHVGLHPWDYAASMLIVEEAGGRMTRANGSAIHLFDHGVGIIATNGRIHEEVLSTVS